MNTQLSVERVDPYLSSEWHGSRTPWINQGSSGPFITISREAGSGGASFGSLLARRLNAESGEGETWRMYEGNLIAKMLEENRLPLRLARFLPEQRASEPGALIGELVGLHPNLWELVQKTNQTMRRLAAEGHVILVGRGANFATAGLPSGTHLRLIAPAEHRARYLSERYNVPEKEALAFNAKCEAARRSYVKAYFGANVADPAAYSLVINTASIPLQDAAGIVAARIYQEKPAQ
jgi:cytidylate kinase